MKRQAATAIILWMTGISILRAATPEAEILRPETADSLGPLWSMAEGYTQPTGGSPPVVRLPPASVPVERRPEQGNVRLRRDVPRSSHPRQPTKRPAGVRQTIVKTPAPLIPEPTVPVPRSPAAHGQEKKAVRLTGWLIRLSDAIQAGLSGAEHRLEAEKTQRLLARSREALLDFFALQPREKAPDITGPAAEVAYARGVMAGTALMDNEALLARSGVKYDTTLLLAGIGDALNRQVRLSGRRLESAQQQALGELQKAEQAARASQAASEKRFVADFRQRRGVQSGGKGVWYRVDQAGRRSGLSPGSVIPLVVKAMLADGTVLRDMQADKKILNTPLGDLPAAWQKGVEQAGYGGAVTVVQEAGPDPETGGTQPVRVYMIRTFDPRNYVFPGRNPDPG